MGVLGVSEALALGPAGESRHHVPDVCQETATR